MKAIDTVSRSDRQRQLIDDAAQLAADVSEESDLIGYIVLAAYSDGTTRTAGYRPSTEEHQIGATLWEAWMRDTLDGHIIYRESVSATYDVLNGAV